MRDADREKYGALCKGHQGGLCPEWVELSMTELVDEETGLLQQLEDVKTWDMSLPEFVDGTNRSKTFYLQALVWLARRKAGCRDDPHTFRPSVLEHSGVVYEFLPSELSAVDEAKAAADADPPANRAAKRAAARPVKKAARKRGASPT